MAGRIRPKERRETEYTTAGQPTVPSYSSLLAELPSEYFQKKPEKSGQELQKVKEELEIIGAEHRRLVDAMEDGRDKEGQKWQSDLSSQSSDQEDEGRTGREIRESMKDLFFKEKQNCCRRTDF